MGLELNILGACQTHVEVEESGKIWDQRVDRGGFSHLSKIVRLVRTSPKCGTLTWWGGLSELIKY